ncbi:nucleoside-diphosphate kinase [Fluviispira multicolorata]|uniref:Nucleoside diphosphate kinase n=1 Tax=Fluviispira multicolorata TaxID=2654512 RepID=A0A833JCD1_9BACT|nr:nucleoside-diphosphate kinase [Fluviispira multicolorata]KAB8029193.1 hypothetical protein GCL57_11695 [Fluviispira multicolorata]
MAIKCNQIPSNKDWKFLSIFGSKKNYFTTETYFRESWFDGFSIFENNLTNKLVRTATVVFKPEAFSARRTSDIINLIEKYNFKATLAFKIKYNRHKIRETWRYQYSEATIDRMSLIDHLYCLGDSLIVFFEDTSIDIKIPASARLHKLKGASEERLRTDESLRSIIKIPNGVIRYFHIPDEPADIVREIGIMFDRPQRLNIFESLKTSKTHERSHIEKLICELESQHETNSFDLGSSWNRVLFAAQFTNDELKKQIFDLKRRVDNHDEIGWEDIFNTLSAAKCNIYDILTIASNVIKQDVDYEFHLIDGDALRGWDDRTFQHF